jgi:hypothetical protein
MTARTMILVSDGDGSGRVQMLEFADGHEAEQRLEQLLEEGVPQESIRAFTAVELNMQVTQRPVVSLNGGASASGTVAASEPAPTSANSQVQQGGAVEPEIPSTAAESDPQGSRDGVRFSSLFKPDGGLEPA